MFSTSIFHRFLDSPRFPCRKKPRQECISQGDEDLAQRAGAKIFTFGSYRWGVGFPQLVVMIDGAIFLSPLDPVG